MTDKELEVLFHVFGAENIVLFDTVEAAMDGTIVRVMGDKRFGFIKGTDGKEYFFHQSAFNGFFDDLVTDAAYNTKIDVTFEVEPSPKGPRAKNVTRKDGGASTT